MHRVFVILISLIGLITGCTSIDSVTPVILNSESSPLPPVSDQALNGSTLLMGGLMDVMLVHSGICFEAAYDARDQLFIMRNAEEHIRFYDLADNSELCRRPVTRNPFDFSSGQVLAGLWSYGFGCTAEHEVIAVDRDDAARRVTITAQFLTEGDCPFELLRPFWVGVPSAMDYEININIIRPE